MMRARSFRVPPERRVRSGVASVAGDDGTPPHPNGRDGARQGRVAWTAHGCVVQSSVPLARDLARGGIRRACGGRALGPGPTAVDRRLGVGRRLRRRTAPGDRHRARRGDDAPGRCRLARRDDRAVRRAAPPGGRASAMAARRALRGIRRHAPAHRTRPARYAVHRGVVPERDRVPRVRVHGGGERRPDRGRLGPRARIARRGADDGRRGRVRAARRAERAHHPRRLPGCGHRRGVGSRSLSARIRSSSGRPGARRAAGRRDQAPSRTRGRRRGTAPDRSGAARRRVAFARRDGDAGGGVARAARSGRDTRTHRDRTGRHDRSRRDGRHARPPRGARRPARLG